MPRSFLVKKFPPGRKPLYRERALQSQAVYVPECFVQAELLAPRGGVAPTRSPTRSPTTPLFSGAVAPPPPSPLGPLDLSGSPSSGEDEEDGGRTSDPPSPDAIPLYGPSAPPRRQTSRRAPSPPPEAAARPAFLCRDCPKAYGSLGALKMHIRSHTLPCVCTTCGKAFSRPWLLRGHIRTHTGERPFACQHCSRAFADRSNLRAHLQTHSEVKKYGCGSCGRTFSRMSLLHKHGAAGCCPPAAS